MTLPTIRSVGQFRTIVLVWRTKAWGIVHLLLKHVNALLSAVPFADRCTYSWAVRNFEPGLMKSAEESYKNGLCFGCLSQGHLSRSCGNRKICNFCGRWHPTALHPDRLDLPRATPNEHERNQSRANGEDTSSRWLPRVGVPPLTPTVVILKFEWGKVPC